MGNFLHPDQGGDKDRDCSAEARAIQDCLAAEPNQAKCSVAIKDLYECCTAMWLTHARTGKPPGDVKDDVCPLPQGMRATLRRDV